MYIDNNKSNPYSQHEQNVCDLIKADIASTGMAPPDSIEFGKIIRFSDNGQNNKNGWYVAFQNSNGSAAVSFGNWKDIKGKRFYNSNGSTITPEDKEAFSAQIQKAMDKAKNERKEKQTLAAKKANTIWDNAKPADPGHEYLNKKKIQSYGLKQSGQALLVPVYNGQKQIISLQEILPNGSKKFLPGGKIKGGFYPFGNPGLGSTIYIGEGYATMASIHTETGKLCIVSFNSGNLKCVAEIIKEQYPDKTIVICADNDLATKEKTGSNPGRIAGEEAAGAIGAELCICPVNSDFNDLMVDQGINAVEQALKKTRKIKDDTLEPLPLPSELLPVAPFDYALLPESLQPWVKDICDRIQCPPDFVAVGVMAALAAVIGRKIGIRPQAQTDWTVVCNLWALVVGRPGVLKSPALEAALAPLNRLVVEANKQFQIDEDIYQLAAVAAKFKKEAGEKQARKMLTKNPKADVLAVLAVDEIPIPVLKRYKANDTSPASLGELLRQNPNGLLVFRDEIVSLLKSLDRDGQDEGRGFYLTAWNGDSPYTFDRIGRGLNLHIPAICISLLGGTQPGRLSEYIRHAVKGGAADDGLIQRFGLIVWPDTNSAWVDVDRWPDTHAKNRAFEVFEYLDKINPLQIGAVQDKDINGEPEGIPYLRFDLAALELFQGWRKDLEHRLRGELHPALESHFAKYRKLIPSLALILHLANNGNGPVSETATLQALAWGEYLETHAKRAYGSISQPEVSVAKAILKRIKKGDLKPPFTTKDVWRPGWTNLSDRDQVLAGLQLLEDYNHLIQERMDTGGRPKTLFYLNEVAA